MRDLSKDGLFFTHPGLSASVAGIDMLQQSSNNLAVLWKQLYYLILWPLLGPETWHWHCYFGNRISVLGAFLRVSISNRARAPGSASEAPCLHQHLSRKIWYLLCLSGARPDHQFSYLEVACPPYRGISLRPAHQRLNWLQFPKVTSETRNAVTWICLSWQGWAGLQGVFLPVVGAVNTIVLMRQAWRGEVNCLGSHSRKWEDQYSHAGSWISGPTFLTWEGWRLLHLTVTSLESHVTPGTQ